KDVWWRCGQDIQRAVHTTTEIRHQRLNLNVWAFLANGSNAVSKVLSTPITQVITVNGGNDHITQRHISNGLRQFLRFVCIRRHRAAMSNIAERATAGTDSTQNHKRRGAVVETLSKVRARG